MTNAKQERRDQRIVSHIRALHNAAGDEAAYQQALNGVRDDSQLSAAQREAIYKTLAQQSLLWYVQAVTGNPLSLEDIEAKVAQVTAANKT